MKIYLSPEVASGLGEDTFWTWFKREVPESEFLSPESKVGYRDVILRYSTMGRSPYPDNTICLLWELYPEMKLQLKSDEWDHRINKINEAIKSAAKLVVSSNLMVDFYKDHGKIDVLPIGLDTNVFKPLKGKSVLRKKYGIPLNKKVGIWAGTTHVMKGFDTFLKYKKAHPEIFWVIIWKWDKEASPIKDKNAKNFIQLPQEQMNELFNCGDFFLSTSRLRPYYMTEWEALATNLPFVFTENLEKDFVPTKNPREQVFELGWDRETTKKKWLTYIRAYSKSKSTLGLINFKLRSYIRNSPRIPSKMVTILKKVTIKGLMLWPPYRKLRTLEHVVHEKNNQNLAKMDEIVTAQERINQRIDEIMALIENKKDKKK